MSSPLSLKIEKRIPIPSLSKSVDFLKSMGVGDSFKDANTGRRRSYWYETARRHGLKVASRTEGKYIRIWRVQ